MNINRVMESKLLISIVLLLALASSAFALTISSVNVINITDTSAIVTWQTDVPATGIVFYGTNKSSLNSIGTQPSLATLSIVPLVGLSTQTTYYFGINATDGSGNKASNTNAGNYFGFTTTVPLFINVTPLPAYVNTNHVDVLGTTKPGAQVSVFVNSVLQRFATSGGTFTFYNVPITQNAQNDVNVSATSAGQEVSQDFTVTSDTTPPVLVITTPIPPPGTYLKSSTFPLIGTVSEPSTITVKIGANGGSPQAVFTQSGLTSFNIALNLTEGDNTVIVDATDKAGNTAETTFDLNVDTIAPTITGISPTPGRPIFENFAKQATIRGKTDPGAKVYMFINRTPCPPGQLGGFCTPDYTTTADSNGNFEFKRVDITHSLTGFIGLVQVPVGTQTGQPSLTYTIDLHFEAVDKAGNVGLSPPVEYPVGTCPLDPFWTVRVNWQAPPILSTERLSAGSEEISMVVEFNYTGAGQNPKITQALISPQCAAIDDWIQNDPKYNWSCRIITRGPATKVSNPSQSRWYFLFTTARLPGGDTWTDDQWKQWFTSTGSEMDFPFRINYQYRHTIDGNDTISSGTSCFSLAYAVDNLRISPRKIMAHDLLIGLINATNLFINYTDYVQKKILQPLVDVTGYACIGSWAYHTLNKALRIGICTSSAFKGPDQNNENCVKKDGNGNIVGGCLKQIKDEGFSEKDQSKFSNDCLKACYPKCASDWDSEFTSYKYFRSACDRLFAHKTPAGNTEKKSSAQIVENIDAGKQCGNADNSRGARLARSTSTCTDYSISKPDKLNAPCYVWGGFHYKVDVGDTKTCGVGLKKLVRIDKGVTGLETSQPGKIEDNVLCASGDESGYVVARDVKCDTLCKQFNFDSGESDPGTKPSEPGICHKKPTSDGKEREGIGFGYTSDILPGPQAKQCCCYPVTGKPKLQNVYPLGYEPKPEDSYADANKNVGKDSLEVQSTESVPIAGRPGFIAGETYTPPGKANEWNYRYAQIKYGDGIYNPDRYYAGRDQYACFGQSDWLSPTKPKLNPNTDFLNKLQCGAIGPLNAQLTNFKNIAAGLQRCLLQIKTTGQANSVMCKQLFTTYVCSSLIEILTWLKNKAFGITCDADARPAETGKVIGPLLPIGAVYEAVDESVKQFNEEYDNAAVQDYLGVGVGQVARKLCMGAFFHDWDLSAKGLVSAAYSTPFETLVLSTAPPNKREFVTINPVSQQATYSYSASWLISPGCDITSYTVQLSCVSQKELAEGKATCGAIGSAGIVTGPQGSGAGGIDCDCADLTNERVTTLYAGRPLRQNEQEEAGVPAKLITNVNRFDHLKFMFSVDPKIREQCFPAEHADGIYYIPLREAQRNFEPYCRTDPTSGNFVCGLGQQLFDKEGTARISQVKINGNPATAGSNVVYTDNGLNVEVDIEQFKGQPKCLVYSFKSGAITKLAGGVSELRYPSPVEIDGPYPISSSDFDLVLAQAQVQKTGGISDLTFVVKTSPTSSQTVAVAVKDAPTGTNHDDTWHLNDDEDMIKIGTDSYVQVKTVRESDGIHIRQGGMDVVITGDHAFTTLEQPAREATGSITVNPQAGTSEEDRSLKIYLVNLKGTEFTGVQDCDLSSPVIYGSLEQSNTYTITLKQGSPAAGTAAGTSQGPVISNWAFVSGGKALLDKSTMMSSDYLEASANVDAQGTNTVSEADFEYKKPTDETWTPKKMNKFGTNGYQVILPAGTIAPGPYSFRITAKDNKKNDAIPTSPIAVTVS